MKLHMLTSTIKTLLHSKRVTASVWRQRKSVWDSVVHRIMQDEEKVQVYLCCRPEKSLSGLDTRADSKEEESYTDETLKASECQDQYCEHTEACNRDTTEELQETLLHQRMHVYQKRIKGESTIKV